MVISARGLMQGIRSMLKPGDVALDCGANIGALTQVLAQTGVEPGRMCMHSNLIPMPTAYWNKPWWVLGMLRCTNGRRRASRYGSTDAAQAVFEINPQGASLNITVKIGGRKNDEDTQHGIKVRQISLLERIDALFERLGEIVFLKVNIEGAELTLLEETLKRETLVKVRLTVAETHENKFKNVCRSVSRSGREIP